MYREKNICFFFLSFTQYLYYASLLLMQQKTHSFLSWLQSHSQAKLCTHWLWSLKTKARKKTRRTNTKPNG